MDSIGTRGYNQRLGESSPGWRKTNQGLRSSQLLEASTYVGKPSHQDRAGDSAEAGHQKHGRGSSQRLESIVTSSGVEYQ